MKCLAPHDVPGECNARLFIADDWADNHATIRCQLSDGHEGPHLEEYRTRDDSLVHITWDKDQRTPIGILVSRGEERVIYLEDGSEED